MIIVGTGGHARDLMSDGTLIDNNELIFFFDNVNQFEIPLVFDKYPVTGNIGYLASLNLSDNRFVLAIGNPAARKKLSELFSQNGFEPFSFVSNRALLACDAESGYLTDVMPYASIFGGVKIGIGCLINSYASVHHNAIIGNYCEISPGARILGGVIIGDETSIGANATILPGIKVGSRVTVGAGAVVIQNLPDNCTAVGVPARIVKYVYNGDDK
jgi:sugar O-acyltransferase (sialic acid O-acetyltransferase NeuD family)